MRTAAPFLLLYDRDCRICSTFARGVDRLAGPRSVQARAIQSSPELLPSLSSAEALASAHVVSPDGRLRSGSSILPALVAALLKHPEWENWLNASSRARAAARRTYDLLVAIRGSLSCANGAPAWAARSPR